MHRFARPIIASLQQGRTMLALAGAALAAALLVSAPQALAESGEVAVPRTYVTAPPAPAASRAAPSMSSAHR